MKYNKKIIISSVLCLLVIITIAIVFFLRPQTFIATSTPPTTTAAFIDVEKIEKISKFRSCQGHTVVPQDESESKRSMKHYVVLKQQYVGSNVDVYSPISGVVKSVSGQRGEQLEGEIWLGNKENEWDVSIQHLLVAQEIKVGQRVVAGQKIGQVANNGIDVVYGIGAGSTKMIDGYESPYAALDSIFNHMEDQTFQVFQNHGIENREELIYTKEFRDASPCTYRNSEGGLNDRDHPEDWIFIK